MKKDMNYWREYIDNIPYVPERDLFRIIKYGTYNLLDLFDMEPEDCPFDEFTEDEVELMQEYFASIPSPDDEDDSFSEQVDVELEHYRNVK